MNDVVKFLVENWYLLIAGVGVAAAAGFMLYRFFKLPTKEQIAKIKESIHSEHTQLGPKRLMQTVLEVALKEKTAEERAQSAQARDL